MSIYSVNRTGSMALAQVAANESYKSEDIGRVLYETQVNDMAFFEAVLACDFNELKSMREGTLLESEVASLNEAAFGEMISKLVLTIFAWMAQQETEERKRRQKDGIEIAKKKGVYKGRKPVEVDKYKFAELFSEVERGERTNKYVMDTLGLKRNTYYKLVDEFKNKTGRFAE